MADNEDDLVDYDEEEVRYWRLPNGIERQLQDSTDRCFPKQHDQIHDHQP